MKQTQDKFSVLVMNAMSSFQIRLSSFTFPQDPENNKVHPVIMMFIRTDPSNCVHTQVVSEQ